LRTALLTVAIAFVTLIGLFTGKDIAAHGVTLPSVCGAIIVIVLGIALVGALLHPPDR
jgi:hydrogenase/urease accessory protein HupE